MLTGLVAGRRRSRSSAVSPGATVTWYQNAHLVPRRSGLTVAAPLITWSLMPSFGYGVTGAAPKSRAVLVSFSQNSGIGRAPPGPGPARSSSSFPNGCQMLTASAPADAAAAVARTGLGAPSSQDQVLRNQAVGSTCRVAASGPALVAWTVIRMSSGSAFA